MCFIVAVFSFDFIYLLKTDSSFPNFFQPGFGYQQQLVPGVRPNFFMPVVQPGPQNQRPGVRRPGAGPVQNRQPPSAMQSQVDFIVK